MTLADPHLDHLQNISTDGSNVLGMANTKALVPHFEWQISPLVLLKPSLRLQRRNVRPF